MQTLDFTTIHFPEIDLAVRDAHKVRGYFGELFKQHSPLLHNHLESGRLRFAYPLVQYKVVNKHPVIVGLNEGARLLVKLFTQFSELKLSGESIPLYNKKIAMEKAATGLQDRLTTYRFATLWMALNQKNYAQYSQSSPEERKRMLEKILVGNILSFYKGVDYHADTTIMVKPDLYERTTKFKDKTMLAFGGSFVTNAILPDYIGLGKSVSRGFGTVVQSA